jgi:hypothetical protein
MQIGIPLLFFAALIGVREAARRDVAPSTVEWGEPVNGVSVGFFLTNTEFRVGEPIEITVFIKNDSEEVLRLPSHPAPWHFAIIATGKDRKPLSRRPPPSTDGGSSNPVQPGKTKAYNLDLNEFLVITNADDLVITAKRFFRDKTGDQSALSGNAVITVRGKSADPSGEARSSVEQHSAAKTPVQKPNPVTDAPPQSSTENDSVSRSKSPAANAMPLTAATEGPGFTPAQKVGIGILAALLALTLVIIWRVTGRKPQA